MIDTHAHIYAEEFDHDRPEMIGRAIDAGVSHIILPNIDAESLPRMLELEAAYPHLCHAAIGLHPTSVKENFQQDLALVRSELERRSYIAIGEIGIDLYWDKTFLEEQLIAFRTQLDWALEYRLPVIIHVRDSMQVTLEAMEPYRGKGLKGIFHSFTGDAHDVESILSFGGFLFGINGIVSFKNTHLRELIPQIGINNLVLETDAPYLSPVPYRGKRNESAYLSLIVDTLAATLNQSAAYIDQITTENALQIFNLKH